MFDRWYDDVADKRLQGRFLELEIEDPALSTSYKKVMKTALVIEIRPRTNQVGAASSTTTRIKPHNRDEMIERFPEAWAAYEAEKAGTPLKAEKRTPLTTVQGVLGVAQITSLRMSGFDSIERFVAMSNSDAFEVLGTQGPVIRDKYLPALKKQKEKEDAWRTSPSPRSTPIAVEGPIDAWTLEILKSRCKVIYEEIAIWDDATAWAILQDKGIEVREFARRKLIRIAHGIEDRKPPVGIIAEPESGQRTDESGAKDQPVPRKRGRPRKNTAIEFGTPPERPIG